MDGYGNGDLSKEDQRRSVEEESARGQREDKVRGVCKGATDHNEDLDQDRIKNDRAELKIQQDCPGGTIIVRTWEENEISKFSKSRREESHKRPF
ncbi:unnamed protein product [Microthlaspi erraticum]|uniref:Uncharacterized protein n=1 Tax=Microthlaspi erraticum TaxID=1685480 RepID=A0A6D2L560_9BRAS|nr:unnamed protein product [Microthlaspi erraticum]